MRPLSLIGVSLGLALLTAFTPLTYGVFRNNTSSSATVMLVDARGRAMRPHLIAAHATSRFPIVHGVAIVSSSSGQPQFRCDLMPASRLQQYYEPATRSYYYRITAQHISAVLPRDARTWHVNGSNQAMQLTAGRSDASRAMTSTLPLHFKLALASGG